MSPCIVCVWLSCDPMDCNSAGSSVHGIFQARVLEWIGISYSIDMPYCFKWQNILPCFLYQFSSMAQSCLTLWSCGLQHARLPLPSQSLLKLMSIELVMPSNHLILCHPLLLLPAIFPNILVFSNESVLLIRWPRYWSFTFSPSNEYSRLISFRMTDLIS